VFAEVIGQQDGVITYAQALSCGLSPGEIRARLAGGRWQRLYRSTYATFTGPVPRSSQLWAAVLSAGDGAVLSHQSAAELVGLLDEPAPFLHVTVPTGRKVVPAPGFVVHRSKRADRARHPVRLPPQTRIEETVVDLTQASDRLADAVGWITRACGRRLARPDRIGLAIDARKKVRWRDELLAVVTDTRDGAHSPLELRYLRDVERAHGLPRGSRQHAVLRAGGRYYDDVSYPDFGVVIELDGRVAHPIEMSWRDMRRDNASVLGGRRVLRYGWRDVAGSPCAVAALVVRALRAAAWTGIACPCGAVCTMITELQRHYDHPNFP
jgi:very-short-patch-repair endonuclease